MADLNAFERLIADEVRRGAEPIRSVDDRALFNAVAAARSRRWMFGSAFGVAGSVAAIAILVLFGGFLLSGMLQRPSDESALPGGATSSPTARAVVELETERVRPGVYRVLAAADGRPLPVVDEIAVDDDGVVWANTVEGFVGINLAGLESGWETPEVDGAPRTTDHTSDLHVAADGTLLAHDTERVLWYTVEDASPRWVASEPPQPWVEPRAVHRASDGSLWVSGWRAVNRIALNQSLGESASGIARYLGDWESSLADIEASDFAETPDGVLWAAGWPRNGRGPGLYRYDDGEWHTEQPFDDGTAFNASHLAVGPEGELWAYLVRHGEPDGREFLGRFGDGGWSLFEKPRKPDEGLTENRRLAVAEDGTVWLASGDWALHDGRWVQPFPDADTYPAMGAAASGDIDIGPDGRVWVVDGPGALFYLTPEALAVAVETSVLSPDAASTPGLLPGVDLATEEVGPGVYRVLRDGAGHDFTDEAWQLKYLDSVYAAPDGKVWITAFGWGPGIVEDDLIALGMPEGHGGADGYPGPGDLEASSDGLLWARSYDRVASYDGDAWTTDRADPDIGYLDGIRWFIEEGIERDLLLVEPDGTVWASGEGTDRLDAPVMRLDADGWTGFGAAEGLDGHVAQIIGTAVGEVWAVTDAGYRRFDTTSQSWERHDPTAGSGDVQPLVLGNDGKLRALHAGGTSRWDGQAWVEQSAWSELPPIWGQVRWAVGHDDTLWLGNAQGLYSFDAANGTWLRHEPVSGVAEIDVAPDGTVWVRRDPRWPTMTLSQDEGSLPSEPDALLAFDGKAWTAYELPRTVTDFDIGPDGTVWAISNPNATIGFEGDTYKGRVNYSEEDWSDIYAIVRDG